MSRNPLCIPAIHEQNPISNGQISTENEQDSTILFRIVVFLVVFVPTLFLPVYPLELQPHGMYYWARPLEAYAFIFFLPVVAFPVAATHFAICFYFAKLMWPFPFGRKKGKAFSLKSLMIAVAVSAIFLGLIIRFQGGGFLMAFYAVAILFSAANLLNWKSIATIPFPRFAVQVAWPLMIVSTLLALVAGYSLITDL